MSTSEIEFDIEFSELFDWSRAPYGSTHILLTVDPIKGVFEYSWERTANNIIMHHDGNTWVEYTEPTKAFLFRVKKPDPFKSFTNERFESVLKRSLPNGILTIPPSLRSPNFESYNEINSYISNLDEIITTPSPSVTGIQLQNRISETYVNWDVAPEGTTHAYILNENAATVGRWVNGTPSSSVFWEKHTGDGRVYHWSGSWMFLLDTSSFGENATAFIRFANSRKYRYAQP